MVAKKTLSTFIQEAEQKYGAGKYDYSLITEYIDNKTKMSIRCPNHNIVFNVASNDFLGKKSVACPTCKKESKKTSSTLRLQVESFLLSLNIPFTKNEIVNNIKYDYYFKDYDFAIMLSVTALHHSSRSQHVNDKYKHGYQNLKHKFEYTKSSIDNGITCLTIFDIYWIDNIKKDIYQSKIKHYLGFDITIYARNTVIKEVDNKDAYLFYDNNHLEGSGFGYKNSKSYALVDKNDDSLIYMICTIGEFYNQSSKSFKYKLHRICTVKGITVVGGISKLSKYLTGLYNDFSYQIVLASGASTLTSVKDVRYIPPRYYWVNPNTLQYLHRNNTQKSLLVDKFGDSMLEDDTESTYMERQGYLKVYDAGLAEINW